MVQGQFNTSPSSVAQLLSIRNSTLSAAIDPLKPVYTSVCAKLASNSGAYAGIMSGGNAALANWRPLTVRLAGYLGGNVGQARDGVFDMVKGINYALVQGARAFVLEIDYLNVAPCVPVVIYRDAAAYMRSINTGSIQVACDTIAKKAFSNNNYDPVIIMVYFRRVPGGAQQKSYYLTNTAKALAPLTPYFLTSANGTNFNNCANETQLFINPITDYQKKIIVLTNYDTPTLPTTSNPTDNLNFWTNARIYQDDANYTSELGSVTPIKPAGTTPAAVIGSTNQYINTPSSGLATQTTKAVNTFVISMAPLAYTYTATLLNTLLNTLGIQSVPLDVVNLSTSAEHANTLAGRTEPVALQNLSMASNINDPLSFWSNAGYSKKTS